jgi:hypothetical protein
VKLRKGLRCFKGLRCSTLRMRGHTTQLCHGTAYAHSGACTWPHSLVMAPALVLVLVVFRVLLQRSYFTPALIITGPLRTHYRHCCAAEAPLQNHFSRAEGDTGQGRCGKWAGHRGAQGSTHTISNVPLQAGLASLGGSTLIVAACLYSSLGAGKAARLQASSEATHTVLQAKLIAVTSTPQQQASSNKHTANNKQAVTRSCLEDRTPGLGLVRHQPQRTGSLQGQVGVHSPRES